MNKNIKTALIILIGILALVTVVGFVYGMQNKSDAKDIYTSYDENILSAVDSAVKVCESAFKDVSATEDELVNLNDYITNINEAKSPVLKGYIADSMLTYTGDFIMVKDNYYSVGIEGSVRADYNGIQEKLVAAKTKLTAARNYNSTTDKSQEQN